MNDLLSYPKEFNNADEIFVNPKGNKIQADDCNKVPLKILSYKNIPDSSPIAKNIGTNIEDINIAKNNEDEILEDICLSSFCATALEISGINAVDNDPMIVVGTYNKGSVIPTATPYKLNACELV